MGTQPQACAREYVAGLPPPHRVSASPLTCSGGPAEYVFNNKSFKGPLWETYQRGWIKDKVTQTAWEVKPKLPLFAYAHPVGRFPYIILDVAEDYSWTVVGYPDRSYLWIMARTPTLPEATYSKLESIAVDAGYDKSKIRMVPQEASQPKFDVPEAMDLKL